MKEIRLRAGLTQEQLAQKLGLRGGKAVISAWENGTTKCEGTAAELLMLLFGGGKITADFASILEEMDTFWARSGENIEEWRQVSAVPTTPVEIDRKTFVNLFPDAAIPPEQHVCGFPFIPSSGRPSIDGDSWVGVLPVERTRKPRYIWKLTRNALFSYREVSWEAGQLLAGQGHTHIRSILELSFASAYFLRRLVQRCGFDPKIGFSLRLDLDGMAGRGIIANDPSAPLEYGLLDSPHQLAAENRVVAAIRTTVGEIASDPKRIGLSLAEELLVPLRADLASGKEILNQLKRYHAYDGAKQNRNRKFGFLD